MRLPESQLYGRAPTFSTMHSEDSLFFIDACGNAYVRIILLYTINAAISAASVLLLHALSLKKTPPFDQRFHNNSISLK